MLRRAAGADPRMEGDAAGNCCSARRRLDEVGMGNSGGAMVAYSAHCIGSQA
jgi:hypothetical protein